ncbi:MAG TPA: hypothetical protein VNZ52_12370 [Candidatus Thermoplasmatota archaeon]|nr:hypothetical protein [Candidatus Thermoplasmatota archaeon]
MTVRADDLGNFVDACSEAGWLFEDTGERVMTDEGPDAEAVIRITIPVRERKTSVQTLLAGISR